jgi:hypothetical protein
MKIIYPFLFLIILLFGFSCTHNKRTEANEQTIDSLGHTNRITSTLGETLIPMAKDSIASWKAYNEVDTFILKYYNISTSEALNNASELSGLVEIMKDSIPIEILNKPNVIARLNVLHNETLRLADMANISSITDKEVADEVKQLLEIYSAFNAKINTIYAAKSLQDALEIDTETPINLDSLSQDKNGNNTYNITKDLTQ